MKLWLVRHARALVDTGVCYGATDIAADPAATRMAAAALAAELPERVPVVCSPLQRCTQLAAALHALRPDLGWRVDARLREMDFGCWEGRRWDDIDRQAFVPWMADFHGHRFGGADSVGELMDRVSQALREIMQGSEHVWMTHAGVIRAVTLLRAGVCRVQDMRDWPIHVVPFGSVRCLP